MERTLEHTVLHYTPRYQTYGNKYACVRITTPSDIGLEHLCMSLVLRFYMVYSFSKNSNFKIFITVSL